MPETALLFHGLCGLRHALLPVECHGTDTARWQRGWCASGGFRADAAAASAAFAPSSAPAPAATATPAAACATPIDAPTQAATAPFGPHAAACNLSATDTVDPAEAVATAVSAAAASTATITSATATAAAFATAMAIATAAISPDLVDTLSFAGALTSADATAAPTLEPLTFQGASREAWAAAHKPV
jgi:pilus assembly protein FimV